MTAAAGDRWIPLVISKRWGSLETEGDCWLWGSLSPRGLLEAAGTWSLLATKQ